MLPPGSDRRRLAGFRWLLALLLLVPIAKAVLADSIDPDFFWHIRVAGQLLRDGIGPVGDPFSYMSRPDAWTPFSWLGELVMKWTYDGLGLPGVVGVHALCAALFFFFIALSSLEATRQLNGSPRYAGTLLVVAFAMALSIAYLSFRPVTFALALMSGMTWLLWRDGRAGDRLVWLLVPGTLLLTNLHLYVILFVVALWARTIGRLVDRRWVGRPADGDVKRSLTLAFACSLAALCTPLLPGCIRNALWFNGEDPMVLHKLVSEIAPFYDGAFGKLMLAGVVAIAILTLRCCWFDTRRACFSTRVLPVTTNPRAEARSPIGFENLFCLLAATVFVFQMGRFATVYAILAMPIAAVVLPRTGDAVLASRPLRFVTAAMTLLIAAKVIIAFPRPDTTMDAWLTRTGDADNLRYPTAAAAYVEANIPRRTGRLVNELTWGGYLIWRLGDRHQVFMDGRTLIYPASFWERLYLQGDAAKRDLLAAQSADAAILPRSRSLLHSTLLDLGWQEAYADDRAVVLTPPAGETATVE